MADGPESVRDPLRSGELGARTGLMALALAAAAVSPLLEPRAPAGVETLVIAATCVATGVADAGTRGPAAGRAKLVPLAWAAVALPAWTLVPLAALALLPRRRAPSTPWSRIGAAVAVQVLAGGTAHAIIRLGVPAHGESLARVAVLVAVSLTLVAVLGLLTGSFARVPVRRPSAGASGPLRLDIAMALTGTVCAELWAVDPTLLILAAGPLGLAFSALSVSALSALTRTDPRTGLANAAHFGDELEAALAAARRTSEPVSVAMLDLDHLRILNDAAGHPAGDEAIEVVAGILRRRLGAHGLVARSGGEEFTVLLAGVAPAAAHRLLDAAREEVAGTAMGAGDGGTARHLTLSGGIAGYPAHGDEAGAILRAAGAALFDAKSAGRNRVRVAISGEAQAALTRSLTESALGGDTAAAVSALLTPREPADVLALPELTAPSAEPPAPEPPEASVEEPPAVRLWVGLLVAVAVAVAALTGPERVLEARWSFWGLLLGVLLVDSLRVDVFERAKISPASAPMLALAFLAGPIGPLLGELAIAAKRAVRGDPTVRLAFDFGALSLAGAAAAGVFALIHPGPTGWAVLVGLPAGAAYYLVNATALSVVMALSERAHPLAVWRERLAWLWPHFMVFGAVAGLMVLADQKLGPWSLVLFGLPVAGLWLAERQYVERSRRSVAELRESAAELTATNERLRGLLDENQALLQRVHRSYVQTISSLARTIEAKDPYTGGHTERVSRMARALAGELGMTREEIEAIEVGSVIHDIGKIGIPDAILLKPGRLDEGEFAEMRRHPEISSYIVGELEMPAIVKQMARSHHERFDGRGYPDGLAGEEIPLAARILSVADALDAMTSDRPYRAALPVGDALAELAAESGRQFCPGVVAALQACMARDPTLGGPLASAR